MQKLSEFASSAVTEECKLRPNFTLKMPARYVAVEESAALEKAAKKEGKKDPEIADPAAAGPAAAAAPTAAAGSGPGAAAAAAAAADTGGTYFPKGCPGCGSGQFKFLRESIAAPSAREPGWRPESGRHANMCKSSRCVSESKENMGRKVNSWKSLEVILLYDPVALLKAEACCSHNSLHASQCPPQLDCRGCR